MDNYTDVMNAGYQIYVTQNGLTDTSERKAEWFKVGDSIREENESNQFITAENIASMTLERLEENENKTATASNEYLIADLVEDMNDVAITGIVQVISPKKRFTSKKGKELELQRVLILDEKEDLLWINAWNNDITFLISTITEQDIHAGSKVCFNGLRIGKAYRGGLEATISSDTTLDLLVENVDGGVKIAPTPIKEITEEGDYLIEGKVLFIGAIEEVGYKKTLKTTLVIGDIEGTIKVNLWASEAYVPSDMDLHVGDIVKLGGIAKEYNNEISLTYNSDFGLTQLGKDIAEKYDVANIEFTPIDEVFYMADGDTVHLEGVITRVMAKKTFENGSLQVVYINDYKQSQDQIEVTIWNPPADIFTVGDIMTIYDGVVTTDDYNGGNKINCSFSTLYSVLEIEFAESYLKLEGFREFYDSLDQPLQVDDLKKYADSGDYIDVKAVTLNCPSAFPFVKGDGSTGHIRKSTIGNALKLTSLVTWGTNSKIPLIVGNWYYFYNVKAVENYDTGEIEVHVDNNTRIERAINIDATPVLDTQYTMIKNIDTAIDKDLENVCIKGAISDVLSIIVFPKCPDCNKKLANTDTGFVCEHCGNTVYDPLLLLKVLCVVNDTLIEVWGAEAEKLIGEEASFKVVEEMKENKTACVDKWIGKVLKAYGTLSFEDTSASHTDNDWNDLLKAGYIDME